MLKVGYLHAFLGGDLCSCRNVTMVEIKLPFSFSVCFAVFETLRAGLSEKFFIGHWSTENLSYKIFNLNIPIPIYGICFISQIDTTTLAIHC